MVTRFQQIHSLADLREYVNQTLCNQYQLRVDAFQLTERILRRRNKPCGVMFCLHGPRAVKFTAIWETERNRVLFYGSAGERFQKTHLVEAPRLLDAVGTENLSAGRNVACLERVAA
jgi:hypothetical protein